MRPFFKLHAEAVLTEANDPELAVLLRHRVSVADIDSEDPDASLNRNDVAVELEHLVGSVTLALPQIPDLVETPSDLAVRIHSIGRVWGEQLGEALDSGRPPRYLVAPYPIG